jgi:hypothetical protein
LGGNLTIVVQVPTQNGARNGVVTKGGTVYLAHGGGVRDQFFDIEQRASHSRPQGDNRVDA